MVFTVLYSNSTAENHIGFLFHFFSPWFLSLQYLNTSQILMLILPVPRVRYRSGDDPLLHKGCKAEGDAMISECFAVARICFFKILVIENAEI